MPDRVKQRTLVDLVSIKIEGAMMHLRKPGTFERGEYDTERANIDALLGVVNDICWRMRAEIAKSESEQTARVDAAIAARKDVQP